MCLVELNGMDTIMNSLFHSVRETNIFHVIPKEWMIPFHHTRHYKCKQWMIPFHVFDVQLFRYNGTRITKSNDSSCWPKGCYFVKGCCSVLVDHLSWKCYTVLFSRWYMNTTTPTLCSWWTLCKTKIVNT